MEYKEVILTRENQDETITQLNALLNQGICAAKCCWGDHDPFKRKRFSYTELYDEGRALKIDQPGAFRGEKRDIIQIPYALPDCGRFFPEGARFFFTESNDADIYVKSAIKQWSGNMQKKLKVVDTFAIVKFILIAKKPYTGRFVKLAEHIHQEVMQMVDEEEMAML